MGRHGSIRLLLSDLVFPKKNKQRTSAEFHLDSVIRWRWEMFPFRSDLCNFCPNKVKTHSFYSAAELVWVNSEMRSIKKNHIYHCCMLYLTDLGAPGTFGDLSSWKKSDFALKWGNFLPLPVASEIRNCASVLLFHQLCLDVSDRVYSPEEYSHCLGAFLFWIFNPAGSQESRLLCASVGYASVSRSGALRLASVRTRKVKKSSRNHRQAGAGLLLLVLPWWKTGKREERGGWKRLLYTSLVIS